jgi:DNA-directed RNA polymerase specialized sigma subunit
VSLAKLAQLAPKPQTRSARDLELWHAWKRSKSDENTSALLKQVQPLIVREASKWSQTLAQPLLETEGKRLAMQAFHTYDPGKGTALGTHVVNQLQKMSRLAYSNQNVGRIPENKLLLYHTYQTAHAKLSDDLGRPPTSDELADELAWSTSKVKEFRESIGRREMLESGGHEESGDAGLYESEGQDNLVDFIHHDMPPLHKAIFEGLTGYQGTTILNNQQLQKKLGLTQGAYSYAKAQMIKNIQKIQDGKR